MDFDSKSFSHLPFSKGDARSDWNNDKEFPYHTRDEVNVAE
jgi:hypothetical protein